MGVVSRYDPQTLAEYRTQLPGADEYVRTADGWRIRRRATTFMRKHGGFDSERQHDPLAAPSGGDGGDTG